jgi:hypothetical protein
LHNRWCFETIGGRNDWANPSKTTEIETKTSKENIPDTSCFNTNFHIHTSLKVINFSKAWNYIVFISKKTQCVLFLKPIGIRISTFMRHPLLKQQGGERHILLENS